MREKKEKPVAKMQVPPPAIAENLYENVEEPHRWHVSAHHARIVEHCQRLLQGGDFGLTPLLPLLKRDTHIVTGRSEICAVLNNLRQLLLVGAKLNLGVSEALRLLPLLGRLCQLGLRCVLAELLIALEQILVCLLGLVLPLNEASPGFAVTVLEVLK